MFGGAGEMCSERVRGSGREPLVFGGQLGGYDPEKARRAAPSSETKITLPYRGC